DHIRVYTQRYANLTGIGAMPININYKNETHAFQGVLPALLKKGGMPIPQKHISVYKDIIRYMNEIIPVIIPDLVLDMTVGEL
ncbi:AAA family ATPase, partial [Streptococcus ruminantium]|nr:AAA family ATPase [Streptococcus ruminantium]